MKRRNKNRIVAGLIATTLAMSLGAIQSPAFAATDLLGELAALNPGVSTNELQSAVRIEAEKTGQSEMEVMAVALQEARVSAAAASGNAVRSSGGNTTVILGDGAFPGDVFISPASTLFIEHGHTGIYYTTKMIVEAPGPDKVSRSMYTATFSVGVGTVKQYVNVSYADGDKAGTHAYVNLRNKPYNNNFAMNKNITASSMNCSQLVWAAYMYTLNVDLDSNGGLGVYPYDIKNSPRTVTYQTL
ncbi:MAG: hypothetical protein FWF43_08725 [Propionibacteriaceae bacterium]|nr:hypothetical protein [Propionibacteriaceae bacterium]